MPPFLATIFENMIMMAWTVISAAWWYIVIWAAICVAWYVIKAERFGLTGPPYLLIYRTTRLNKIIERISAWNPTLWRTFWNIGIVTGVGLMMIAFYFLSNNLSLLLVKPKQAGAIQPIIPIPGVGVTFQTFPYLAVALSILLVSHELSHGIASLADHIPLKSTGLIFAHVVMGGFVEPVEEKLNQARNLSKLRVFAAGSFTNIVLGIFVLFLAFTFPTTTAIFYSHGGVTISSISPTLPAYHSGLSVGDTVTSVNGTKIADVNALRAYMGSVQPGQVVLLQTQNGTFAIKTAQDPTNSSHALIGVGLGDAYSPKLPFLSPGLPAAVQEEEFWLYNVLISVAFINMLPAAPFDGDKYLDSLLKLFGVKDTTKLLKGANTIAWALLLANIGLSLIRFGFVRY